MKQLASASLLVLILASFIGCSEDPNVSGVPSFGSIDKSSYVAIGNSLSAGMMSGGVREDFQRYSYPNLIAQQLATSFVQPLIPAPGTGDIMSLVSINPLTIATAPTVVTYPSNLNYPAPYNNLGIPGAILYDAIDTSSIADRAQQRQNPYYVMFMRDQNLFGRSMVAQALKLNPTILTFWLGNNDALGYVTSGGVRGTNAGLDGQPARTLPTEKALFQQLLTAALGTIKTASPSTKVVVGTIPDPTSIPFVTTVPRQIPNPNDPTKMLSIYFRMKDGTVRTVAADDYVLLTAQVQFARGFGFSPALPLPSDYVLDASEVVIARQAVDDFNTIIKAEAARLGYAVADVNAEFKRIVAEGYHAAGEAYSVKYISGGIFSFDGVHPTPRGQGILANVFLRAMNSNFGANIPLVEISLLPAVPAPTGTAKFNPLIPMFREGELERALSVWLH